MPLPPTHRLLVYYIAFIAVWKLTDDLLIL